MGNFWDTELANFNCSRWQALRTNSDHYTVRCHSELQRVVVIEILFAINSHHIGTHTMMSHTHQNFPCTDDCKRGLNVRGSLGVDPDILNLVKRWRKMVNFIPLEFYFSRKYPRVAGWIWMLWRNFSCDCAETNPDYMEVKLLRLILTDTHSKHIQFESSTRTDIPADVASVFAFSFSKKMPVTNASSNIPFHPEFKLDCHISL
jgi:hypothetical protein